MSLAQFDRLPPTERDLWIIRWERDQATCPDCGRPREECSDPERTHYPFRRICYVTMERDAASAAYDKVHEKLKWHNGDFSSWAEERDAAHPYHYASGVKIGVADYDLAPHDKFTTEVSASPAPPASSDS